MKKLLLFLFLPTLLCAHECYINLSKNWKPADPRKLPSSCENAFILSGRYALPPTINITRESHTLSHDNYLAAALKLHQEKKGQTACLIESPGNKVIHIDSQKMRLPVKIMQKPLSYEGGCYIITLLCASSDFLKLQSEFHQILGSAQIIDSPTDLLTSDQKQQVLEMRAHAKAQSSDKKRAKIYTNAIKSFEELGAQFPLLLVKSEAKILSSN